MRGRDDVGTPPPAEARWDVPSVEALRRLVGAPLPLGLRGPDARRMHMRDLYLDTPDAALRTRGATCRFRHRSDDRRELMVALLEDARGQPVWRRAVAEVPTTDAAEALAGSSEPARLLRSLASPAEVAVELELAIERYVRAASHGWLRRARLEFRYDVVTVRAAGLSRAFQELTIREVRVGTPGLDEVARAVATNHGLRAMAVDRRVRGGQVRSALESEALARGVGAGRWVAVLALDGSRAACILDGGTPAIPSAEGSGEEACRHLMRRVLGSAVGDLHLLSTVTSEGRLRSLEIWMASRVDRSAQPTTDAAVAWLSVYDLLTGAAASAIRDPATLAALDALRRSGLLPRLSTYTWQGAPGTDPHVGGASGDRAGRTRDAGRQLAARAQPDATTAGYPLLDAEISTLEFNGRVLALAEDESVPLLERLRYLAIVTANLDEFFMVRVAGLKDADEEVAAEGDGVAPTEGRLAAIAGHVRGLVARQYACFAACREALQAHDVRIVAPESLDATQRAALHAHFLSTIFPYLTPRAITTTPGHSFPLIPDLSLCMAVVLRDARRASPAQFAEITLPAALPRFVQLPDDSHVFLPLEDVIRPELPLLYRGRHVEHAYVFRVTRDSTVALDEPRAGNLAQTIQERAQRRRHQPIVRVEMERAMPATLRELLLRELQLEPGEAPSALGSDDEYEIPGLLDLGGLRQLADLPMAWLRYPPFVPEPGLDAGRPLWETLRERDVLLHHPYDDFGTTVGRFFAEAADDPDVAAMKLTLYRAGERSPIVDALIRAAQAGKDVAVFVELKARFDEQRNVQWAKQLEQAGVHVVQAVSGVKNHAKAALIVRREAGGARRYAHIGTGNYNAATARFYTDLGLLTAREALCADVHDLFNALTGSSAPTDQTFRECLVAPTGLLPGLLERIEREAEHARAGRGGRIRMKCNGLSDREVVHALYRASQAGVEIDLVVRGMCTLCPGVPGVSDRIRVVSRLGRFLEHARILHFAGGGRPEYFIGSADLRPRNLRRRVEMLAPVHDAALRARLDRLLDDELADPTAWDLARDGRYARRRDVPAHLAPTATDAVAAPVS